MATVATIVKTSASGTLKSNMAYMALFHVWLRRPPRMKEAFLSAASGLTLVRTEVARSEDPGRHKAICSGDAALLEAMRIQFAG
jgi:hypothetical protein